MTSICISSIKEEDPCDPKVAANVGYIDFVDGEPALKRSHNYYAQVQMQMALTKAASCNFVVWTTKNILVLKVDFDQYFWQKLQSQLIGFF